MKPLVGNAGDESQVRGAEGKEKRRRDRELDDVRFILNTPQGRRFYWRLMSHCKTFGSVWEASARIHYNAGMQDVGHFLLAELNEAAPSAYLTMIKEIKEIENV